MISSVICKNCEGFGCNDCNFVGWQIYNDTDGTYYFAQVDNGKISVGGMVPAVSFWKKIWINLFSEPHDFLWAVEKIKRAKERNNKP